MRKEGKKGEGKRQESGKARRANAIVSRIRHCKVLANMWVGEFQSARCDLHKGLCLDEPVCLNKDKWQASIAPTSHPGLSFPSDWLEMLGPIANCSEARLYLKLPADKKISSELVSWLRPICWETWL